MIFLFCFVLLFVCFAFNIIYIKTTAMGYINDEKEIKKEKK